MQQKKIPMRSCCACREKKAKNELVRVVRTPEGEICLDLTGKRSGRGVYICNSTACLNKARKIGALSRALECEIPEKVFESLQGEIGKNE